MADDKPLKAGPAHGRGLTPGFKDTSGPSLNILIKLIAIVLVVFAGLIVRFAPAIGAAIASAEATTAWHRRPACAGVRYRARQQSSMIAQTAARATVFCWVAVTACTENLFDLRALPIIMTMMATQYTVSDGQLVLTLEPMDEGGFLVRCPMDPGVITEAETIPESFTMARDAMQALRAWRLKRNRSL